MGLEIASVVDTRVPVWPKSALWKANQPRPGPRRRVFVHEAETNTKMVRGYGPRLGAGGRSTAIR